MDNGRRVDLEVDPLNLVPGDIIFLQAGGELEGCGMNCFMAHMGVEPKIVGFPPKSSMLIGFSIINL